LFSKTTFNPATGGPLMISTSELSIQTALIKYR